MSSKIHPTVGRVMLYWPGNPGDPAPLTDDQPFKADVIYVHGDTVVNLDITTHNGQRYAKMSVLISEEAEPGCAQWMPYQKGQAARDHAAAMTPPAGPAELPVGHGG